MEWPADQRKRQPSSLALPVLLRDALLLAVNKPSGLAVHRGWARDSQVVMTLARDEVGQAVHPVHRLDRGTSGVLLLALERRILPCLQERFASGLVRKRYVALVRGVPPEQGVIDHPIPRSLHGPRVPAVTSFRLLGTFERYALVEATPHTGRLHQVRRHLKHISHPLIGDVRYGKGEHNRLFRERFGLHRLALHAFALELEHPGDGARLRICAPLPPDFAGPLAAMGLPLPEISEAAA